MNSKTIQQCSCITIFRHVKYFTLALKYGTNTSPVWKKYPMQNRLLKVVKRAFVTSAFVNNTKNKGVLCLHIDLNLGWYYLRFGEINPMKIKAKNYTYKFLHHNVCDAHCLS